MAVGLMCCGALTSGSTARPKAAMRRTACGGAGATNTRRPDATEDGRTHHVETDLYPMARLRRRADVRGHGSAHGALRRWRSDVHDGAHGLGPQQHGSDVSDDGGLPPRPLAAIAARQGTI